MMRVFMFQNFSGKGAKEIVQARLEDRKTVQETVPKTVESPRGRLLDSVSERDGDRVRFLPGF